MVEKFFTRNEYYFSNLSVIIKLFPSKSPLSGVHFILDENTVSVSDVSNHVWFFSWMSKITENVIE